MVAFEARYCPACGTELVERRLFGRVRRVCPACGFIFFREPKVAVGALVVHKNRVLLVRRAVDPERGKWALPAGYMEYDEEPVAALRREIAEETGLEVDVKRLLDVFPIRTTHARGVIIVYETRPVGGRLPPPTAGDDVSEARWFGRDEIPWPELAFESTRRILERWVEAD